jgi:hypothetical protein
MGCIGISRRSQRLARKKGAPGNQGRPERGGNKLNGSEYISNRTQTQNDAMGMPMVLPTRRAAVAGQARHP